MGSRSLRSHKYFRDRKSHPNLLNFPHNFKILIYCCLLRAILYLLLIPYLPWWFTHTSGMAVLRTDPCQLSAEWLRLHTGQLLEWSLRATQLLRKVLQSTLASTSAASPCQQEKLQCRCAMLNTYSWKGTVQWGSEPTQIPAPPINPSSVNIPKVSLIHLLCISANISIISGSNILLVCDTEITHLLKTTKVGGKFGCFSVTVVFPELKPCRHSSQSTMSPRSSTEVFSCWCTTDIHLPHKHIPMCFLHINSLGYWSELLRISTSMISETVF